MLCSWWGIWEEDSVTTNTLENWKKWSMKQGISVIRNTSQKTECERSPDNTHKDGEFVFSVAGGTAKLSGRDYEFQEPTPRPQGEIISAENLMAIGKSFKLKKQKMTKDFWAHAEARKEFHFSSSYWTEKFNLRAERRIISNFTRLTLLNGTPPWRNIRCGEIVREKPKHLRRKQIQFYWYCREGRNSVIYFNCAYEFVPMKRSQESSSLNLWKWKPAHVVSSRGTAYLWQNSSSNPKKSGEYEILSSVNLGREKYELRMWFWSANFGNRELLMVLRDACLGKPRSTNKESFIPSIVDSRCKGDIGKGMKGGHKERTQKQKIRKVHFAALMDIRHKLKYKCILENVARAISSVEIKKILNWDNHWWSGWRLSSMKKLREWIQNHPPVQVPSLKITEHLKWILINRGLWITVHHCVRKKKTSIICVANLHSLPWNITSKAHKIRTALKRRWIFKRASGNRCLHDAGKTRPPRKAAAAAAVAAAILWQHIREQKSN